MSRRVAGKWLALFGLIGVVLLIFIGAALPLDEHRQMKWGESIAFKPSYQVEANFAPAAVAGSAVKHLHIIGFSVVFFFCYAVARRRRFLKASVLTFVISVLVELAQGFIASRTGALQDVASTFVALGLCYLLLEAYNELRQNRGY